MDFLFTPAVAQSAAAGAAPSPLMQMIPFILVLGIMYLFMVRPHQKRMKAHKEMINNVKIGEKVITQGGIYGKITKIIDENQVEVEIAKDITITLQRSSIQDLVEKPKPVNDNGKQPAKASAFRK